LRYCGAALSLLLAASVAVPVPASAAIFTLQEALAVAYQTNPQLEGARAAVRALDEGVAQANAGWRPSISATGSYGIQNGDVVGIAKPFNTHPVIGQVTLAESVYRGGRTYAEVSKAIADVKAGRYELLQTEQSVLLSGVTAYMDVVRDSTVLSYNIDNQHTLQSELDAVNTQFHSGAVTKTDVEESEGRLARAKADVAAAERQLATSRATFKNVIGRPAETLEANAAVPPIPKSLELAETVALAQHPNVLDAKERERSADLEVDDAAGALQPQVSVQGQYQYLKDAAGTNIFATPKPQVILNVVGQVTVPIYQGGGDEATVRRAKELRTQSVTAINGAQRDATQEVDSAWQDYFSATSSIQANQAQVKASRAAVEGVKLEQQAGERQVLDILNAQEELLTAQVGLATAQHDQIVAAYRLMAAVGRLTARNLALNVPLYDPREHYGENASSWFGTGK
jgi:outer membrane protein